MPNKPPMVTVHRFQRVINGAIVSPQSMWGTAEAIAGLSGCRILEGTEREIPAEQLEGGFYFESVASSSINIDEV
jgi:hypothetical protein